MLDHNSLLFSPTRDGIPSSDDNYLATDILAAQSALEDEARSVIPFAFDTCTYYLGPLKQPIYACRTCLGNIGVCAGCSIACHSSHDLVEIFNRRDFVCDCGTQRGGAGSKCNIDKRVDAPSNTGNKYDHNFKGSFCHCSKAYDPHTEEQEMYQCLVCEDWNHHDCVFGAAATEPTTTTTTTTTPPPLHADEFDSLICHRCVTTNVALRRILDHWAGAEGRGVVVIDEKNTALGKLEMEDEAEDAEGAEEGAEGDEAAAAVENTTISSSVAADAEAMVGGTPTTSKRLGEEIINPSSIKRSRLVSAATSSPRHLSSSNLIHNPSSPPPSSTYSSAPGCFSPVGESRLEKIEKAGGRCNVFLQEDYHIGWCRCEECLPLFNNFPYLLEEEVVYEPPVDKDLSKSGLELGLEALSQMPRAQAIEGAMAFSGLSERLRAYLAPHAARGKTISKQIIDEFFESERDRRAQ